MIYSIHQMYGHILLLVLLVEVVWTLVESIRGIEPNRFSTIKSKVVVGLADLQVLTGIGVLYLLWPNFNHLHPTLMILAIVGFHVANKQADWARFGLQFSSLLAIVFGYVLVVG
jgi:hypothetical protein